MQLGIALSALAAGFAALSSLLSPTAAQTTRLTALAPIVPPSPVPAVRPLRLSDFPGRWIGTGELQFAGGVRDVLQCRITYFTSNETRLRQSIRCQSSNLRLDIKTQIEDYPRGEITGEWNDRIYDIGGRITGHIKGNAIRASVSGRTMNAALNVIVDGNQQTIELVPQNSVIRSMRITLARG